MVPIVTTILDNYIVPAIAVLYFPAIFCIACNYNRESNCNLNPCLHSNFHYHHAIIIHQNPKGPAFLIKLPFVFILMKPDGGVFQVITPKSSYETCRGILSCKLNTYLLQARQIIQIASRNNNMPLSDVAKQRNQ